EWAGRVGAILPVDLGAVVAGVQGSRVVVREGGDQTGVDAPFRHQDRRIHALGDQVGILDVDQRGGDGRRAPRAGDPHQRRVAARSQRLDGADGEAVVTGLDRDGAGADEQVVAGRV